MKRSRLRPISKRRMEENKIYKPKAKKFVETHPLCVIKSKFCTVKTRCVHHGKGRGIWLCDERYWFPACYPCNGYLETGEGKKWGYEKGFRLDRIGI